jgi:hypothetical protein
MTSEGCDFKPFMLGIENGSAEPKLGMGDEKWKV